MHFTHYSYDLHDGHTHTHTHTHAEQLQFFIVYT